MAKSRSCDETLKESLSDPEETAAYLNVALEEGGPADFLLALKDVANVTVQTRPLLIRQRHI